MIITCSSCRNSTDWVNLFGSKGMCWECPNCGEKLDEVTIAQSALIKEIVVLKHIFSRARYELIVHGHGAIVDKLLKEVIEVRDKIRKENDTI